MAASSSKKRRVEVVDDDDEEMTQPADDTISSCDVIEYDDIVAGALQL